MTLYIGSEKELVEIDFDENNPAFHTKELRGDERIIYDHIPLSNILYLGSDEGCGCGFRHALLDGENWLIVESEENSEVAKDNSQKNQQHLYEYIKEQIISQSHFYIYGCWDGDLNKSSKSIEEIVVKDLLREDFYFKERGLYKIYNC